MSGNDLNTPNINGTTPPQIPTNLTTREKSLPPIAPFALLFLTTSCVGAAFWLALSQGGSAVIRPAATVMIAGLAGGLVCVSTRDTRSFDDGRWLLVVYSWFLTAFAGATTSLGVFILASVAFVSTGRADLQYSGLGLLGAITGYLGASLAVTGALKWGPSLKSPLDQVNREVSLQLERVLPSLQPRVSQLMEEAVLGPPIPPYNGYIAVERSYYPPTAPGAIEQAGVGFAVWFDTSRPIEDAQWNSSPGQSQRKISPIVVRGQGSRVLDREDGKKESAIPFDVLLHIPSAKASPMRRSISVPQSGPSSTLSFAVASADLEKGAIPVDTLLEIRCRGMLVQIVDFSDLERTTNA